jgi:hypothetical protein
VLPQPCRQVQVSADQQAEVQVSDCKALQLVSADQASLVVVDHLVSLRDSRLLVSLHPALVDLSQVRLALRLPLAVVDSHQDDPTQDLFGRKLAISC